MRKPRRTISFNLHELKHLHLVYGQYRLYDEYLFDKLDNALFQLEEDTEAFLKYKERIIDRRKR